MNRTKQIFTILIQKNFIAINVLLDYESDVISEKQLKYLKRHFLIKV